MGENCNLCREFKGGRHVIYKDDYCFAIIAKWPIKRGHIMVLPIRHVSDVSDLTEKEAKAMFKAISLFQMAFPKIYGKDAMVIQNPVEKRTEIHIHYHILPTKGGIRDIFSKFEGTPLREEVPEEEMNKMSEEIKEVIAEEYMPPEEMFKKEFVEETEKISRDMKEGKVKTYTFEELKAAWKKEHQ